MYNQRNAGIISVGAAVPERVLTNADLEKIVDTSDEWIRNMTGITERRIAAEDEATSDYAIRAARVALERAGLGAEDIDLIILATFTGDTPLPSTACLVQAALGQRHSRVRPGRRLFRLGLCPGHGQCVRDQRHA